MRLKENFKVLKPATRLYKMQKPILGLTGGIATGKSSVSKILKQKGIFTIDADLLVKEAYKKESVIKDVLNICPNARAGNEIDFKILRSEVFQSKEVKLQIEKILYAELPALFVKHAMEQKQDFIIYDVPLLFERNLDVLVDQKICVYCKQEIQRQRLNLRDKNSNDLIDKIMNAQIPIEEKRSRSDYVIDNSLDLAHLENEVEKMIQYFF
jgi:dephospho-CoA kinase